MLINDNGRTTFLSGLTMGLCSQGVSDIDVENPANNSVLPDGYTQLEYLESTGTQVIDTGIPANDNTGVLVDIEPTVYTSGKVLLGARANGNRFWFSQGIYGWNVMYNMPSPEDVMPTNVKSSVSFNYMNSREFTSNGVVIHNFTETLKANGNTIAVFCGHDANVYNNHTCSRVYSLKISVDKTIVGNFIPARRDADGELGFYNIVNGEFHTNIGSDALVAGPEVVPDEPPGPDIFTKGYLLGCELRSKRPIVICGDASGLSYTFDQDKLHLTIEDAGIAGGTFSLAGLVLSVNDADMISFTIRDNAAECDIVLHAEKGMTWEQWISSPYNSFTHPVYPNCTATIRYDDFFNRNCVVILYGNDAQSFVFNYADQPPSSGAVIEDKGLYFTRME